MPLQVVDSVGLAGAIGIIKCRDGAGGLALDLSRGGAGGAGCGLCAVYEEVLSFARGVFGESEPSVIHGERKR